MKAAQARSACMVVLALAAFSATDATSGPKPESGLSSNPFLPPGEEDRGWPSLRGANFDGHSAEIHLADHWPAAGPPVLWTRTLGQGYSSFAAWDGRIATQYQTLAGQYVVCLDSQTGETLWQHRYDWPYEPAGVYPGPRATPAYADGLVYYASPAGAIGCLDAATGKPRWSVDLPATFPGMDLGFGYACSPTLKAGKVILPAGAPGASLVALDAKTGAVVWQAGNDAASYTPAYPIIFRGRPLVLGYLQNALVCHDLETGELVWRRPLSSGYDEHSAWPIYSEPYLWISSPFQGGSELLELTGDPATPVKTVRVSPLLSNDIFSSVLHNDALFGFDLREAQAKAHRPSRGRFRCLDFLSGEELWTQGDASPRRASAPAGEKSDKPIGHATVLVADGKLILLNDTGELILARASRERYQELGRVAVLSGEICWTQPALDRGRLFVRNQSRAVCIYLGDPDLLAPQARAAALTTADIPQSPYVDVAAAILGIEPEYAFDLPSTQWLWRWFAISLIGIMGSSLVVVALLSGLRPHWFTPPRARRIYWLLVFVFGALGTTFLSTWLGDFVFTWPVALFAVFHAAVEEVQLRLPRGPLKHVAPAYEVGATPSETGPPWKRQVSEWRARLTVLFFPVCCLAYFLFCRRLSLVFEWVFLCGFAGALPFLLAVKVIDKSRPWSWLWEAALAAAAFAAFFWSSAAILFLKA